MDRRGFLSALLKAGVVAMVLPAAVTYARRWKLTEGKLFVLEYQRLLILRNILDEWKEAMPPLETFGLDFRFEKSRWLSCRSYGVGDVVEVKLNEQIK